MIRIRCKVQFKWFDFWVGAYYDVDRCELYVCLVPMLPIKFWIEVRSAHFPAEEAPGICSRGYDMTERNQHG